MAKATGKANVVEQATEKKHIGKMVTFGKHVVDVTVRQENTVRDLLLSIKGKTPKECGSIAEGIRQGWKEHVAKIHDGDIDKVTEVTKRMMLQAVYNRQSEQTAVCKAFALYAGMDDDARREVDDMIVSDCQNYHKLVELARHINRATRGEPMTVADVQKAKKARGELTAASLKAIERNIKLASIEQLKELDTLIRDRIAKATAPVNLAKERAKRAEKVRKARSAFGAVNGKVKGMRRIAA